MFSGLSRCFSFIAHVMAHKRINEYLKEICQIIPTLKKKRARERDTQKEGYLSLVKGTRQGAVSSTVGKSKMTQGGKKKVLRALALIEMFSSILSGRAGVSVMPARAYLLGSTILL